MLPTQNRPFVPLADGSQPAGKADKVTTAEAAIAEAEADAENGAAAGDDGTGSAAPKKTGGKAGQPMAGAVQGSNGNDDGLNTDGGHQLGAMPDDKKLTQASAALKRGDTAQAGQHIDDYLGKLLSDKSILPENLNVDAIIQAVLLNSYKDGQEDLKYYAQKVNYFQQLRKGIRDDLSSLRDQRTKYTNPNAKDGDKRLTQPITLKSPLDDKPGPDMQVRRKDGTTATGEAPTASSGAGAGSSTGAGDSDGAGSAGSTGAASTAGANAAASAVASAGGPGMQPVDARDPGIKPPLPAGDGWVVYKSNTDSSYVAINAKGGSQDPAKGAGKPEVRLYDKDGQQQAQIWGDAHMTMKGTGDYEAPDGKSGGTDLHGASSFVLQDGSQVALGIGSGADGKPQITSVDVVSNNDHYPVLGDGSSGGQNKLDGGAFVRSKPMTDPNGIQGALVGNKTLAARQGGAGDWKGLGNKASNADPNSGYQLDAKMDPNAAQQGSAAQNPRTLTTTDDADNEIKRLEDQLQSVGDDAQLAQTQLQALAQQRQELLQAASNLSKGFHDTRMAILRNISG